MSSPRVILCSKNTGYILKGVILGVLLISFFISGCGDQRVQVVKRTEYQPVYMTQQEFVNSVGMEQPRELYNPGKIYLYDRYLFVNEINKGVHIIDNRNPSSPTKVGFINIPANKDIAVKNNYLYADSHSDLLVFNIEDMQNPELVSRKEDVFSVSATNYPVGYAYQQVDPSKGIIVDWKQVVVEETCEGNCTGYGTDPFYSDANNAVFEGSGSGGIGGSLARFAITGNHLYAVDKQNLLAFDISSPDPNQQSKKEVGWAIETIFPHKNSLFIGSESAMYIYDISNPNTPSQLSVYTHFTACDPVVVEENFAYVTLRSGNRCANGVNRLEVIDVKDLTNPQKVGFYGMINPHGLGIDDGNLFVSEGEKGLKIMDASDPYNIQQLRHITDIKTKDVIPFNDVLIVTGKDGIVQYDYSDINNVTHLSTISVTDTVSAE